MKVKNSLLLFTLLFCSFSNLITQNDSYAVSDNIDTVVFENSSSLGIIAKKLLTDYNGPIDNEPFDFQKWNGGFELGLRIPVNDYLSLAVPFKASSVSLPETNRNVNILSLDIQGQFYPLQKNNCRLKPYLASGMGVVLENGNDVSLAIPLAIGTNIHINKRLDLNLEMAYRIGLQSDRNNYQFGIGFIYNLTEIKEELPLPLPEVVEDVPEPYDHLLDSDGDGVPDIYDLCPNVAGLVHLMGCPDSDGDGIPDHLDKCPNEAGPAENDGCPVVEEPEEVIVIEPEPEPVLEVIPEEVQEVLDIAMRDVQFDLGRATLRPESFAVLNQVAEIMKEYPRYRLRIAGHTDNIGSASNNQRLSEQRARSCYEYLASRGVSTARMSFIGFGESRPIASNDNPEGRATNRRVEFQLYID